MTSQFGNPVMRGCVRDYGKTIKWKGLQGVVVGSHDSAVWVTLLANLRKRGKDPRWYQDGILLTIRPTLSMGSNLPVPNIPIEFVYHQLYVFLLCWNGQFL